MDKPPLKVGVIGANANYGWSRVAHLPAIVALPELELAAVCTAHEDTANESASHFGASMAFHNHKEMLKQPDIDIVLVSVKVPLHHSLTIDALNANKHVYTEWPLARNTAEAKEMADLANVKGVHTMVGLQGRSDPSLLRFKELIEEGYVGEVLSCHMGIFSPMAFTRTSDKMWYRDKSQGASTLTINFGHVIDGLCECLGEFIEVSAMMGTRVPKWLASDTGKMMDVTSPDNVLINGTLHNGTLVSTHVGSVPYHGRGQTIEVYGREGTLILKAPYDVGYGTAIILGGSKTTNNLEELQIPDRLKLAPKSIPEGPVFNVAQMWRRFAKSINDNTDVEPNFNSAVIRHSLLDAIELSSETGELQKV